MGKLYVVGFGPGGYEHMTAKCIDVIKNADVETGYTTYVNILKEYFPNKNYIATPMMQEVKRCEMAVEEAMKDQTVAMVSSGDSGIYGILLRNSSYVSPSPYLYWLPVYESINHPFPRLKVLLLSLLKKPPNSFLLLYIHLY